MLRRFESWWWVLVVLFGAGALSGCRCGCFERVRHGCILRGSFSLEFNRVPWINSRCETSDECSELGAQLAARRKVPCGLVPDCPGCDAAAAAIPAPPVAPAAAPGEQTGEPLSSMGCADPSECPGLSVGPIRRGLARAMLMGHFGSARPKIIEEPYLGPSRFHPVPTRPAFSPREEMFVAPAHVSRAPASGLARHSSAPGALPRPPVAESGTVARGVPPVGRAEAVPTAPVPDHLATLPDEPPETGSSEPVGAPRPLPPTTAGAGTGPESWVFVPPAEPKKTDAFVPAPVQETTRSNGWVRRR